MKPGERMWRRVGRALARTLRATRREPRASNRSATGHAGGGVPAPTASPAREYTVPASGLPPLRHDAHADGEADPGEVVWAWVPYEEDATVGKDRPVLVVSRLPGGLLGLQLTSRDHSRTRAADTSNGRYWMDVGSGDWDARRRDSEVRLDRLLFLPTGSIRREGAALDRGVFLRVAAGVRALHARA
ncbi:MULTISPECIES: type II toxin-antitoxin system PemK/MazF family toxin [unclassified Pseudactinotalea]|uniref:type II toxin-antitoxin system PemK/MazF family toxin n=1 Tax=unclassified Pseudactinotalea TaxID=2649176 RepID=UPI00128CD226|nr:MULTISPECIES: type II toxin-antitoxin system PemK/MazF family toxin [unclassified Pseudactinotalea]MPV48616.1 type II toxin-antitoxin system PemK/MazF family toxin [Pseudactinotalea sp. HY160]QGH68591.1 type II toxin-antitoxin system PemK/MazF family toxin [Pseudactinotalea sp. HY158]